MTTADWNDEEGNKIRLVFTPQIVNEDGYETTLNVIEVECTPSSKSLNRSAGICMPKNNNQ